MTMQNYTRIALDSGNYTTVPNSLIADPTLTPQERMAWIVIAQHQWGKRESSWPGVQRVAECLGVHEQTARGYIHSLRDKGFLSVTERPGYTNVYELFYATGDRAEVTTPSLQATPSPQTSPTPSPQASPPLVPRLGEQYKEEDKVKKTIYSTDFESFWQAYPRKIAKAGAYRKWQALVKRNGAGPGTEALLTAAQHYQQACRMAGTEENFVMHAATFLGPQLRWEDYLSPPKPTDGKQADWRTERLSELAKQIKRVDLEIGYLSQKLQAGGDEEDMSRHEELLATRERLAEEGKRVKEGVR